jgi:hypothetical protein
MSSAYERLLSCALVFTSVDGKKVRSNFLSKRAIDIKIENNRLPYAINSGNNHDG